MEEMGGRVEGDFLLDISRSKPIAKWLVISARGFPRTPLGVGRFFVSIRRLRLGMIRLLRVGQLL
jgi:hypothetical protein